jgi:hypothetical protein
MRWRTVFDDPLFIQGSDDASNLPRGFLVDFVVNHLNTGRYLHVSELLLFHH